jgi:hypothetical protein
MNRRGGLPPLHLAQHELKASTQVLAFFYLNPLDTTSANMGEDWMCFSLAIVDSNKPDIMGLFRDIYH